MTLRLWGGVLAPEDIAPGDGIAIGPTLRQKQERRYAPQSTLKIWDASSRRRERSSAPAPVRISWRKPPAGD